MSDPLSKQAIECLREYVSADYTSQLGAETRRETILALIAAHERTERENAALREVAAKADALISRQGYCQDAEDESDDGRCAEPLCEYCELDRAMGNAARVLGEKRGAWKAGNYE